MFTELHVNYTFRKVCRVTSGALIIPQRLRHRIECKYPGMKESFHSFATSLHLAFSLPVSLPCHPLRSQQEETRLKYNKPRRRYDTPRGSATSVNIPIWISNILRGIREGASM